MIYQYVFIIIEPIILYEFFDNKNKILKNTLYILFTIIIFRFATIANIAYFHSYLAYENIYSFTSSLTNRILETEGFTKDTTVVFVGEYNGELNTNYYDYFKEPAGMGSSAENGERINPFMRYEFIKYFIGIDLNVIFEGEEVDNIKELSEFKEMKEKNI